MIIIQSHPEITFFSSLKLYSKKNYNATKMQLISTFYLFIS